MNHALHTVLGATGAIGKAVVHELKFRNLRIRAVQRKGSITDVDNVNADILLAHETMKAIKGSTHVYMCTAVPYSAKLWQQKWPLMMKNVIDACAEEGARLIFLDNIYMYGPSPLAVPFTEHHPQFPPSAKGQVRKQIADMLMQAASEHRIKAIIGRSADIYGPGGLNSPIYHSFLSRMLEGKAPQSLAPKRAKITYAYIPDIGKALVMLALTQDAYQQVWHLPVGRPISIQEIADIINKELGTHHKVSYISKGKMQILSLFIPILKEIKEMMYQYETEYYMSFEKFHKQFPDFQVTPYEIGIPEMVRYFKK